MDLETYLRVFLDAKNDANRPLAEHRLIVSEPLPGVLVIRVHPDGFNAEERVFQVQGDTVGSTSDEVLAKMSADAQAAEHDAQNARDLEQQARAEAEREAQGKAEIEERLREKATAEAARPADPSKLLPDGDPTPAVPAP